MLSGQGLVLGKISYEDIKLFVRKRAMLESKQARGALAKETNKQPAQGSLGRRTEDTFGGGRILMLAAVLR